MVNECQHKQCGGSNKVPHIMSAVAAIASALAAFLLLVFEWNREEDFTTRQTFLAIREHKDRMVNIGNAHTCAEAIANFPESLKESTRTAQGEDVSFECDLSWCDKFRHCVGSDSDQFLAENTIKMNGANTWQIALPVRRALESYNYVALMGCRNILEKDIVLEEFKTAFRRTTSDREETPILKYITSIYPLSDKETERQLPGLSALIGALYPNIYKDGAARWKNNCPELP